MGVSARAGDHFPVNGLGTPMLGVDSNGNLVPIGASSGTGAPTTTQGLSVPASNTNAVVTLAAVPQAANSISGVLFSYAGSGTLTGGRLTVQDGTDTVVDVDVTSQGTGPVPFPTPVQGQAGRSMTITLYAGGANVQGKLTVFGIRTFNVSTGGSLNFGDENNSGLLGLLF